MTSDTPLTTVAHTIQLSVAPVFLLTAIGTFLAVLSTRLGRIVDRARVLVERVPSAAPASQARLHEELALLARRRHLINMAITSGVSAALLVCTIISSLFLGTMLDANVSRVAAVLFQLAMLAIITALVLFLREVLISVANIRIDGR